MKKIGFLIILFLGLSTYSQETLNYPFVNKTTYDLYLKANWEELIQLGDKSLNAGIDFYYLQVRMGIAYYNLNNFRKAVKYLQKAHKTNREDEFVSEYLYKAYLYSASSEDARVLSSRFSKSLKNKLDIKESPIFSSVYVETKFDDWDDYKINTTATDELEQIIRNSNSYYSVNFENLISPYTKLFWGFTRINVENKVYKLDENNDQIDFIQDIKQNQLYFNYSKQFNKGANFSVALNYIYSSFNDYDLISRSYGGGFSQNNYGYIDIIAHEFALNLSLNKDISNFTLGFNTAFSSLNESFQIQPGINLTYYPFGNTNVYLRSEFNQQFDFLSDTTRLDNLFKQSLGFRIMTLYVEPYLSVGKMANFTNGKVFVIYNDDDFVKDEMGVKAYAYLLKKKLELYAEYKTYDRINYYKINTTEKTINYNYQSIIGGVKWNF